MQLRGAGDGNGPRLLCEQPRESDLRGGSVAGFADAAQKIDMGMVCFASLGGKPPDAVAYVSAVEGPVLVDFAGEEIF
jgi:hypothetical protein